MTPLIIIITIAAYFLLLLGVAALTGRSRDNATFFTGGRRTPWPIVAIATIGAAISGVTFISVPGMVGAKGYSYLQMSLGFIAGYAVIAWVLIPVFYKRNVVSIYGYLGQRFGSEAHRSGAWIFFVSKMLGASIRFFVVCAVLQVLVFTPLGVPFALNVIVTVALVWLYTVRSGVGAVIWTDVLKSLCLVLSVVLCTVFIAAEMDLTGSRLVSAVVDHPSTAVWNFSDPMSGDYFFKQFLAGVFMVIAMTGLDQDMMQRNLACRDSKSSRKNMMVSSVIQFFVIAMFLVLGTMLLLFAEHTSMALPEKSDELFGLVATHPSMPIIVGILFVVGLISAAYSAAGSALTSLTTSFSVDILKMDLKGDRTQQRRRSRVHLMMAVMMGALIVVFYHLCNEDAISAVYTLASYTYGPILGLFAFGLFTRRSVNDRMIPLVCVAAPVLSWAVTAAVEHLTGYQTGFELLLVNALLTMAGLAICSSSESTEYVEGSVQ